LLPFCEGQVESVVNRRLLCFIGERNGPPDKLAIRDRNRDAPARQTCSSFEATMGSSVPAAALRA